MNTTRIVAVGSPNTVMVIQLAHLPAPGETELGGAFSMAAGARAPTRRSAPHAREAP